MSIVELNGKVCDTLVIDSESMTEQFMAEGDQDVWKWDPEATEIALDEDLELEDDIQEAITELEGDAKGVAECRAYYDLNELEGGFCCQTLGLEYTEELEMDPGYMGFMTSATKASNYDADPVAISIGFTDEDITITWGAEVFASGRALAASAVIFATTAMACDL